MELHQGHYPTLLLYTIPPLNIYKYRYTIYANLFSYKGSYKFYEKLMKGL